MLKNIELEQIDQYEQKVFDFIDRYKKNVDLVIDKIEKIYLLIIRILEYILFGISDFLTITRRIFRYTTFPIHWLYIKFVFDRLREESKLTDMPIFELGGHYFYGRPGSGKSTVCYHASIEYAYETGKTAYTTQQMELPRKDIFGREYYYHQLFDPAQMYVDGQKILSYDTSRHNMVIVEEMLQEFHQRNHAKKSHTDIVIPMIANMGGQRHEGIDLFYFISQLPSNDISIMLMLKYFHEVKIVKRFDYKNWLETGKFKTKIKGWKIISSQITPTGRSDYKLTDTKRWFYKCKYDDDMKYFMKLNLKHEYEKLPKLKGVEMKA